MPGIGQTVFLALEVLLIDFPTRRNLSFFLYPYRVSKAAPI